LEQLGVALKEPYPGHLRQILSCARKLSVVRFLYKLNLEIVREMNGINPTLSEAIFGYEFSGDECRQLKYFELNEGYIIECGELVRHPTGNGGVFRKTRVVSFEQVKHISIFGMDTGDVVEAAR
jgi:hypothetical protein